MKTIDNTTILDSSDFQEKIVCVHEKFTHLCEACDQLKVEMIANNN